MSEIASFMVAMLVTTAGTSLSHAATTTVVLPDSAMTSAGVFDATGRLVRTLWSGERRPAGSMRVDWDGRDDDGVVASPSQQYRVRVLAHDVRHVWEGVIGNSSADPSGGHVHRAFGPINDMAIDPQGNGFYVVGYNELQHAIHRFRTTDPGRQTPMAHDDYLRVFRYAATDGTLAYFANIGGDREPESFVMALRVADGAEHRFPMGEGIMAGQNHRNRWVSAIDHSMERGQGASGLAVQRQGELLFVAHKIQNEIRVFNKLDGARVGRIPVAAPGDLDVGPDDSLWVVSGSGTKRVVVHYQLRAGSWEPSRAIDEGLIDPVAIGISPRDGTVLVADAGSDQLKAFDAQGGAIWTHGLDGGYRSGGPDVAFDRLWLSGGPSYVTFAPDGSFWVGDAGNVRNLHFSPDRGYLGQIMYLPASYVMAVDTADPSRVFRHFMEFSVDYSKPVRQSWRLVRNWAAGLDPRYRGAFEGLESVHTLPNRRTYGVVRNPSARTREVVELTSSGLRGTGDRLDDGEKLYPDGTRRFHRLGLGTLSIYERRMAGFDAVGNPQWDPPERVAAAEQLSDRDPHYHDVPLVPAVNGATYPQATGGVIVSFSPGKSSGFHLGGLRRGQNGWMWRASPSGPWAVDEQGQIIAPDGRYGAGHGVQYPGNVVMTSDRHVVYGYHGEAWNGGQANQWLHFLDNGLFVGQFGKPAYPGANRIEAVPEVAGNAFSPALVAANSRLYLWHNDESAHGGLHRWRVDGIGGIRMIEAPIAP